MVNDGKNRIILRNTLIFTSHHPYSSSTKTLAYTLRQQVWYFLPQFHHMPANTNSELPNYHSQETVEMSNMGRGSYFSLLCSYSTVYYRFVKRRKSIKNICHFGRSAAQPVILAYNVPTADSFTNSLSVLIRSTLVKETISRVNNMKIYRLLMDRLSGQMDSNHQLLLFFTSGTLPLSYIHRQFYKQCPVSRTI